MNGKKTMILGIAMAMIGAASLATAHGPGGGPGGGRGPGMGGIRPSRGERPVGILRQLVFPCPAACNDTAKDCNETAENAALACVSAACETEIGAAQTACADDLRADACKTAFADLRECAADCLDTQATAVRACRDALATCVDACDSAE